MSCDVFPGDANVPTLVPAGLNTYRLSRMWLHKVYSPMGALVSRRPGLCSGKLAVVTDV